MLNRYASDTFTDRSDKSNSKFLQLILS